MSARTIMIQGTGSSVGKSVITAALCSYFRQEGLSVAPFKSQNMSNNSFVTPSGGEIGRAQAFQAQMCGIEPAVEMNPILLKPSSDIGAQVVVLGKAVKVMAPREYHAFQPQLKGVIRQSLEKLSNQYDVVVIEGAGSPAEINLREFDIVNMAVAKLAAAPVLLVGDINLGGVFASLVGTLELLTEEERSFVKGFVINKFRGDISLLDDGLQFLEARTGRKVLGVLPFARELVVAEEDAIPETKYKTQRPHDPNKLAVEVILLPHISNSTDFDALEREAEVSLRFLSRVPPSSNALPDVLILPGSKSSVADLLYLRSSGFAGYIDRCREQRVPIVGICGGYQILGREILDPDGVESPQPRTEGLCLLDVRTRFEGEKSTIRVRAKDAQSGVEFSGYEIHMGRTTGPDTARPLFEIVEELGRPVQRMDGAKSENGLIWGTYLHGMFDTPALRRQFLNQLRERRGWAAQPPGANSATQPAELLATMIRQHINLQALHEILQRGLHD